MADYGTTLEPGIVTDVSSSTTVSTDGESPSDVGIVGQADLTNGTASPNAVYQVTRASDARNWFGETSLLTDAVTDALNEGAFPVYAVAVDTTSVTDEDISGLGGTSGSFANAPVSEDPLDVTITVDGNVKEVFKTYDDPSSKAPTSGEAYYNPIDGAFELGTTPGDTDSTNDTVEYTYFDYPTAHQALSDGASEAVDFFVTLNENDAVRNDALAKVDSMAQEYNFAMVIAGAGARVDPASYTNTFDDSRVQLVYPSRDTDDNSILGAYAGLRAAVGITSTPINKRLDGDIDLATSLAKEQRGSLIDKFVVPIAQEAAGPRVADDVNTVSDSNSDEANIRYGFTRLVLDYVLDTVRTNEGPFIGRLNSQAVRNALEGLLKSQLKPLKRSNAVTAFSVEVRRVDATTASVELGVETAKPLRFIENTVAVGGVQ